MNSHLQTPLIVLIAVIIAVGSFTYGALTAPRHQTEKITGPVRCTQNPVITTAHYRKTNDQRCPRSRVPKDCDRLYNH